MPKPAGTIKKSNVSVLDIESNIPKFSFFLTNGFILMMHECWVTAMHKAGHSSESTDLKPYQYDSNIIIEKTTLKWSTIFDDKMKNTHTDANRTTDYAAMWLSLILTNEIIVSTNYTWHCSSKGDGVDFWIVDNETFDYIARLEVSGIQKETTKNNSTTRAKVKIEQTKQSDHKNTDAYIAILEFSKPSALLFKR